MQVTIDQAKVLCSIVEFGGYTQAAHKLHRSHSSLIYAIKNFESTVGFSIFDRTNYRNQLTLEGIALHSKCIELIKKLGEIESLCKSFQNHWSPQLTIVLDGIIPQHPLLQIYQSFKKEQIPTKIHTHIDFLDSVEEKFETLKAEVMISLMPIKLKNLFCYSLTPIKMFLVAHIEHPLHQTKKIWNTSDLKDFLFLTVRHSSSILNLGTDELEEGAMFSLPDFNSKRDALLNKMGFGWLPEHLLSTTSIKRRLRPVRSDISNYIELTPKLYLRQESKNGKSEEKVVDIFLKEIGKAK